MRLIQVAFCFFVLVTPTAFAQNDSISINSKSEISNFHRVDANLFRSGRPTPEQVRELPKLGIKTIVSLETYFMDLSVGDEEERAAREAGLEFIRIPMNPLPTNPPSLGQIEEVLSYLTDPALQPVLVHCYHGSDRVGIVVGAYHIRVDGWSPRKAILDMRNFGHSPLFYHWDSILYGIDAEI